MADLARLDFTGLPDDQRQSAVAAMSDCELSSDPATVVREMLSPADEQLDYARAKIAFDRVIDPAIDEQWVHSELGRMTNIARDFAGGGGGAPIVVVGRRPAAQPEPPIIVTAPRIIPIRSAPTSRSLFTLAAAPMNGDDSDYERDLNICRRLASPAARSRCYGSAEARRYARENGRGYQARSD
jgi:hypothetical protein